MELIPTLRTARFLLRPVVPADAVALFPTFSDPAQMYWWSRPPFESVDELADWLIDPEWDGRCWVAVEGHDGPAIGRFAASVEGEGISEIGYMVARDRLREGIARECLAALLTQLLRTEGQRRVYADVDPDNTGSNRLLEGMGFKLEGRLRASWVTHIGVRDSYIWGMLAEEWDG
jgi:[ribosomal protein S5]-alanine N-acetyltransferase